jgi:hypothetical protein
MNEKPMIVERGKITYLLYNEKVIVGVGGSQWISYNQYDNWNRQGITLFKNKILKSKESEYGNVVDQMSLAVECGIRGTSTRKPEYE